MVSRWGDVSVRETNQHSGIRGEMGRDVRPRHIKPISAPPERSNPRPELLHLTVPSPIIIHRLENRVEIDSTVRIRRRGHGPRHTGHVVRIRLDQHPRARQTRLTHEGNQFVPNVAPGGVIQCLEADVPARFSSSFDAEGVHGVVDMVVFDYLCCLGIGAQVE